jgi:hypothetical protein
MTSKKDGVAEHCHLASRDILQLALECKQEVQRDPRSIDWEQLRQKLLMIRLQAEGGISQINFHASELAQVEAASAAAPPPSLAERPVSPADDDDDDDDDD